MCTFINPYDLWPITTAFGGSHNLRCDMQVLCAEKGQAASTEHEERCPVIQIIHLVWIVNNLRHTQSLAVDAIPQDDSLILRHIRHKLSVAGRPCDLRSSNRGVGLL